MKLIGSLTEDRLREELQKSQCTFVEHKRCREILPAIGLTESSKNQIAVLEQFPDTDCANFRLLLPNKDVVRLNVPNMASEPIAVEEILNLDEYRVGLSQIGQVRLAVALQFASSTNEISN